ncbi:MAG: YigZ family protein [Liquorilactobacillus hordei]|uniref:YigZ family protein n=1 Tax=Liquorilactobacillus hordei TaxID=468911 RepID=UPI0039E87844
MINIESYLTIAKKNSAELTVKKSTFVCNVARTTTEQDAQMFIEKIKGLHPKARHHCFAYLIGSKNDIQRQSDNGEPSGTAGVPILDVLLKKNVRNTTAVVTRYFGGIKLGTGGLIRAYGQVTTLALNNAIVLIKPQNVTKITIDYAQLGRLQNFAAENQLVIESISYQENIQLYLLTNLTETSANLAKIRDLLNGKGIFKPSGTKYIEIPQDK